MTIFRRFLTGSALAMLATGLASADNIISFTVTIPATATDLVNVQNLVTSWDPGGTGTYNTTASDSTSYVSGLTGFQSGVTMAGLNAANTTYTLHSYDLVVQSTLAGSYTATAGPAGASGSVGVTSYTGVALGGPLSPALTVGSDSTNDIFYNDGGPTAKTSQAVNLGPNASTGNTPYSNSKAVDLGFWQANAVSGGSVSSSAFYTPITSSLGSVSGASPLDLYLSTATATTSILTSGNVSYVNSQTAAETITVVYDYTSTVNPAPESATFALMGGGLIALGLMRKRFKKV